MRCGRSVLCPVRWLLPPAVICTLLVSSGCAVHYFDAETGAEHLWGVGHMVMRPGSPNEGLRAVARRTDTVGVSMGKLQEGMHFDLGWGGRQRIEIVGEDTQLCLAWPQGPFYTVRVGSQLPPDLDDCTQRGKEKMQ